MPKPPWLARRTTTSSPQQVGLREGFRSGLEQKAAAQLLAAGLPVEYETTVIAYTVPQRTAKYHADFHLPNGTIIETKGRFVSADRKKHKLLREQFPDLDIRLIFNNPNARISKKSVTTYAKWCETLGIPYAKAVSREAPIPQAWLDECKS